ncbi:proteoglycan 4 isoform X3 [Xenopus tropicalis]|uniref:Proteoglycan 4 n=1 Tax=Xenopus tropicalis TaxID=8364 RepID=A0A6I8RKD1_XENTR|nr:proteoglycan 4 isoform X3 [Xenopus tropicalis]
MERKYYITQVVVCLFILSSAVSAQGEGSCVGRCGEGYFRGHTCHCDYNCMSFMECCRDFKAVCTTENSCRGRCHEGFIRGQACDCDPNCLNYGKCCPDFESMCAKPISRRSPAPPPPEERRGPPDPSRNKDTDKEPEADKVPQEPDEDTGTTPSTVITPQPVKEKKQMPKKPKKPKKLVEAEEEIEETEENETSSTFSTTRTKGTTIKVTRKDSKKKKPKDKNLNPKANSTEPGRGSFSPSVPPPPDKNADILMTPQTPRVGDDAADPVGSQEDSTDNPSSSTTPKTTKKRSPSNTNKKKINKKQENEESPSSNNKKKPPSKPSPKDIKRKKGTDPKDEKQDPAKGPDPSAKKDTKKPVSKGPKKRIIKVLVEDDTEEPQKPVKKKPSKKPSPKDTKRKKKFNPKEERQETVESEFTSSSQSTSSHRRSKSTSTLLSGKNKNIKNKNRKKIPDEKPLMPPKRKKDKDFLQTPEPTPADEGSGDDGSGMEFLQTTPSATSLSDSSPKETLFSTIMDGTISSSVMPRTENIVITSDKNTETPKALSTVEPSLRTTPGMNIFTDVSTVSKEPFKQTETPAQPTEESTMNTLTTLQEQSTPDNKSNANSYTTNSEGLQTSTSSMLKSTISTSHTNEPSSSTIRNIYDTPNQTSNVEYSTHKPSEQKDASSGQSTVFFTTQTIDWVPSSNAGESKENSTSTEGTNRLSSPTVGQQTEDLTTLKPELTDANTSGNRTYADLKETATTTPTTQPMESVSTTTQVNVASQQATTTSSENQQEHTTKDVTTKQVITEQQTKIPSVSSFSNSTVKSDLEQRPTVPESDPSSISNVTPRDESMANGTTTSLPTKAINIEIMETTTKSTPNTIKDLRETTGSPTTVKAISVEQMENKYNPNPPLSLDQYGICEMLLDKENKLGISESDLQSIREICMEIHPNFTTSVSTPSSETKLPSQNPSEIPTKHTTAYTTTPRVAQPNKKPLPPKTIIQIVEEINRKMHLTPTRNLTLFPSHKTNKSAAWILLLKKIRSPLDPQMNLCNGQPADGMTTLQNGSMVVFRGHYFWTLNQGGAVRQARKISDVWGIPSPIDTVFTRCNCAGKTFFFKGPRYWRFTNDVMDKGYPKEIIKGFGGLKGKITSVLSVAGFKTRPESVYFFKGGGNVQKYTFRQEQSKRCTKKKQPNVQYPIYSHNIQTVKYRYPRDVVKQQRKIQRTIITIKQEPLGVLHQEISIRSTWRGIPNNIVSAISLPNSQKQDGFDYFVFSKEKYYNINMSSKVAIKPPPNSEQKISKDWYKCKE